jgi:hypothetical protein
LFLQKALAQNKKIKKGGVCGFMALLAVGNQWREKRDGKKTGENRKKWVKIQSAPVS